MATPTDVNCSQILNLKQLLKTKMKTNILRFAHKYKRHSACTAFIKSHKTHTSCATLGRIYTKKTQQCTRNSLPNAILLVPLDRFSVVTSKQQHTQTNAQKNSYKRSNEELKYGSNHSRTQACDYTKLTDRFACILFNQIYNN